MANKTICLFDVDGTLTSSRQKIQPEYLEFLKQLRKRVPLGIVSGSDVSKIVEQLGNNFDEVMKNFDYVFTENGLVAFKDGQLLAENSINEHIGEEKLQEFINFSLAYMSKIVLPVKRGVFVEFRKGMLNISPIGRACSQSEREQFAAIDNEQKIREKFVEAMRENFPDAGLQFSIGGQISIDVFPKGWDKSYCLQYLLKDGYNQIHFFGDRTFPGGNDYEIFVDPRTIGHAVKNPDDTKQQLKELFPDN